MKRNAPKALKISFHSGKNLYRKTVGKYAKADGTLAPRDFWLGSDPAKAMHQAQVLATYWDEMIVAKGDKCWSEAHEQRARSMFKLQGRMAQDAANQAAAKMQSFANDGWAFDVPQVTQNSLLSSPSSTHRPQGSQLILEQAAARTVAGMKARQVSIKCVARAEQAYKQIYDVLPAATPMAAIDRETLLRVVGHFLARPISKRSGKPMKVDSIRTLFCYFKQVLDEVDGDGWDGPRKWQRHFRVRWTGLQTPQEQRKQATGKDTFTTAELSDLYELANDRQKLFMLLGLNTGMNQKEISTLMTDDVDLAAGKIARIRNKTRATAAVRAEWVLWPQTAKLLKQHLAVANEQGLALLSEDGNPLVNDDTDTDSIALTWSRLLKTAKREKKKVRPLPFGTLRKTSATWIRNHAGEAVQQLHLAHAGSSVASRHYTGKIDFTPLHTALQKYYEELKAAGIFLAGMKPASVA